MLGSPLLSAKVTWNGNQHGSPTPVPFGALRWLNVGGSHGQRGHSGVHDRRPRVLALLTDTSVTRMVVAYWDRLCRFGAHYLETLFVAQPRRGRSKSRTWRRTIRRARLPTGWRPTPRSPPGYMGRYEYRA